MLSFCMNIDSLSAMLNEFEMHSVFLLRTSSED